MPNTHLQSKLDAARLRPVLPLFTEVCDIAGNRRLIEHGRERLAESGVIEAVVSHNNDAVFDWLITAVSYQGIGDAVASQYMETHGMIAASDIRAGLAAAPPCPKLRGFWTFEDCRFHKGSCTCAEPEHIEHCPLPRHDLRNGRLNQSAYALYLFFRDVAQGNFVGWIDTRLSKVPTNATDRSAALGHAVLEPLSHVHGVSNKVLSMALSDLFLALAPDKPNWREAGAGMVAIDSLVHNWLHRTGVLQKLGCDHLYGDKCYGNGGCAEIIRSISSQIDARNFNPDFPKDFPRFVQKAIWWFCAQSGLSVCNGNQIDDTEPCDRNDCPLRDLCERRVLHR